MRDDETQRDCSHSDFVHGPDGVDKLALIFLGYNYAGIVYSVRTLSKARVVHGASCPYRELSDARVV